ncbi:uncharacterized protein TNCV_4746121 [Trichonephila clavipes]|nr:uncharacterized protein TNCV_4746121 [Trichonephila clavipes]
MVCLEEIAAIANILKTAPASTVQLLHKIVNDEPYSKSSRKELKKFAGFPQNYDIEARKDKILKDFTKTELITVCTILGLNCAGSAKELSEHIFKNLSDLASLKNNFTEQLTDDEDEDSAPFSLESTKDANKQPLTPPIYHLPSPQDVFVPLPQTQRNQSQRGNEENCEFKKPDVKHEVVNEVVSEVVNEINSSSEMRKTVKINGYDFDALIDTGSTITLIRESVHQILGRPTLNPTKINLASFGKSEIKTFGSFKSTIDIEDNKFMTDIYVIDNLQTTIDVIIGTDVLKQTEFKITANGIELISKKKDHFINLINVSKAHNQSELKDNALEVLQLKLKNAEDKCKKLEMHVSNTSTLSLEKTALLDKLHELEESNLEKVDKLVKLEEKYEILQETLKITERRLVEKEIECASLTEKILIVNALTESNDHPKTSKSTKEREINPSKRKAKKSKSRGRNANKTSHSDVNQAFAKEKNDLLRQIDFLNSIILDTKLKEPNKSKAHFFKKRRQLHKYKKHESVRTQSGTQLKLRSKFCEPYLIKTVKPHDRNEVKNVGQYEGPHLTSTAVDFMKRWSTADA